MKEKRYWRSPKEKIIQKLILLALPLVLLFGTMTACEGPSGSEGPQGPKGEQGVVGPAGEDGSVIHAGKGAPKGDIGESGDYYLNRTTGELYGPKNNKGWGTPISLKGPSGKDGQDGADGKDGKDGKNGKNGDDGSQIHSGTGAPAPSLGANGDYYLDKASFNLYGPKDPKKKNNWGTPINLKGTANVMYSSWIKPAKWEKDKVYGNHVRYFDIAANAITQDVLDKGVVNVYADFVGGPIYQLPVVPAGDYLRFYFELKLQNLRIGYVNPDDTGTDPGSMSLNNKFRFVIIPGGVAAKSKLSTEQLKKMSYQEIKQHFDSHE